MRALADDPQFHELTMGATRRYVDQRQAMSPQERRAADEEVRSLEKLVEDDSEPGSSRS